MGAVVQHQEHRPAIRPEQRRPDPRRLFAGILPDPGEPREHAAEVLILAQQLDNSEHSMYPFIEKFHSIVEAVKNFGRI